MNDWVALILGDEHKSLVNQGVVKILFWRPCKAGLLCHLVNDGVNEVHLVKDDVVLNYLDSASNPSLLSELADDGVVIFFGEHLTLPCFIPV